MGTEVYFDSKEVESWLLEYRLIEGDCYRKKELEEKIWDKVNLLIQGIIFTHRFQRFMPYEDCFAVAQENILRAFNKYDPDYDKGVGREDTKLFNYLSIVAKQSIYFATRKYSVTRLVESADIDEQFDIAYQQSEEESITSNIEAERILKYIEDNINIRQHKGSLKKEVSTYMFKFMHLEYSFDTRTFNRFLVKTDFYKLHPDVEISYINACVRAVMKEIKKLKGGYDEPIQPKGHKGKGKTKKASNKVKQYKKEQRLQRLYTF